MSVRPGGTRRRAFFWTVSLISEGLLQNDNRELNVDFVAGTLLCCITLLGLSRVCDRLWCGFVILCWAVAVDMVVFSLCLFLSGLGALIEIGLSSRSFGKLVLFPLISEVAGLGGGGISALFALTVFGKPRSDTSDDTWLMSRDWLLLSAIACIESAKFFRLSLPFRNSPRFQEFCLHFRKYFLLSSNRRALAIVLLAATYRTHTTSDATDQFPHEPVPYRLEILLSLSSD